MLITNCHKSWEKFIKENEADLNEIESKIGDNYTPTKDKIFRFMENDLNDVKVIILGQDPYPQEGVATGRCFEVTTISEWTDKFRQTSLKNIVRVIYRTYTGNLLKYNEIKEEMITGEFNILKPAELFKSYQKQGVLLLNKYLTCEINKAGSHEKIWKQFSEKLITYISEQNKNIYWFLWGAKAIENEKLIEKGNICRASHPRINTYENEHDFLNTKCFEITKNIVDWRG